MDVQSRTSKFGAGVKVAIGALAGLAAGAAYAFNKFEEAENVMQQTDAVLKSTGGVANVTSKQVADLADSISKVAGVDDEAVAAGENMLLTFKNIRNEAGAGNDIFNQTVQATVDMAAAMAAASGGAINMKSSTIQLGKALNDPIAGLSALTRVGIQFTEQQQKQIEQFVKHNNLLGAQKLILGEVTSQFAGSAEAQATASGKISVAFENLAETVGGLLAPAIGVLAEGLGKVIKFLQDEAPAAWKSFTDGVQSAWNAVKPFATTIGNVLIPLFQTMWHTIQDRVLPVLERIKPLLIVIGAAVALFATMIVAQFALVVTAVGFVIDKFLDLVGFVRDKVVEPIVNFLGRIGDAIGKVAGWVKDRFIDAWQAVKAPVLAVLNAIIGAIADLIGWIRDAINWLGQLGEGVSEALAQRGAAAGVFSGVKPPGAQHGGVVTRTGLAMVHRGEAFSGVNNEMGFGGINGDIVLQVNGATLARISRDELLKMKRSRGGTLGLA